MAVSLPSLTTADVQRRVGSASFDRSRRYVGHLDAMRREGRTLTATCQGSMPAPYDVTVTFDTKGVARADCTCPVGDGGHCKHVAALLQTWMRDPDGFTETEPVGTSLHSRSREELVGLVEAMIAQHPDLRDLLEMPLPGAGGGTLSPGVVQKQVQRAFSGDLYEWGSAYRIGRELTKTLNQAEAYVAHESWANAATVCLALLHGIQKHYETMEDHDGHLTEVVNDCVSHLGACLAHTSEPDARALLAEALFEVRTWDIAIGGIDLGYEATDLLKAHATDEERRALCERIEADLARTPTETGFGSSWRREALGGLLLELTPGEMSDEAYIALCRTSGRTADLVDALLELGRLDEALDAAREVTDVEMVRLAPLFAHHDHAEALDALALDRLDSNSHWQLVDWIQTRARDGGNTKLALALTERQFQDRPSAKHYVEALDLARTLRCEDAVRARLRDKLLADKAYVVLTHAYLHDGEHAAALKLVHLPDKAWGASASAAWGGSSKPSMRLTVAAAVARTHPDDALELYLEAASDRIERRGRSHYADAARYLIEARTLFQANPHLGSWASFMNELRGEFKGLPALRDELDKAGL